MVATLKPHVEARPTSPAIVEDSGITTWQELDERVNRWVGVLREAGLSHGDRVVVFLGNRREVWEVALACLHAGFVVVPVNSALPPESARYIFEHCDANALIVEDASLDVAVKASDGLPLDLRIN